MSIIDLLFNQAKNSLEIINFTRKILKRFNIGLQVDEKVSAHYISPIIP